jgi:hypothetical protein
MNKNQLKSKMKLLRLRSEMKNLLTEVVPHCPLQLNPQHNIPVIVDGDFVMNESRAMAAYLVNAYGKNNDKLYPIDPKVRAVIDQRLNFDIGTFLKAILDAFVSTVTHRLMLFLRNFDSYRPILLHDNLFTFISLLASEKII